MTAAVGRRLCEVRHASHASVSVAVTRCYTLPFTFARDGQVLGIGLAAFCLYSQV